ncbi:hypothetical protein J4442_01405 [Candidatus Woesearchaeota archaeon]|nr:hypothetical protein [Candidatus Woesearchaeota archaeon]
MEGVIEERQKKIVEKLNLKKNWYWFVFALIACFGYWIRTRNLPLLIDATTGKYTPLALDPDAFLRYVRFILEHGALPVVDYMRYYPWGFQTLRDFNFLSHFITYLYKFIHFFNPSISVEKVFVLYPPIAFVFGLIFFFLLVRKLFDYRVALLSSFFLATVPPFLQRTMAGFSDKESLAIAFMFISFYFFISAWKAIEFKRIIIFGILAGIFTGFMGMVWGGVTFTITTISGFSLVNFVFIRLNSKKICAYASWFFIFFILMTLTTAPSITDNLKTVDMGFAAFTLIVGLIGIIVFEKNLLKIKEKITNKLPVGIGALLISLIFGLFAIPRIKDLFIVLTNPFGQNRWALTVAEAHQPYLIDLINALNWKIFVVMIFGVLLLFYKTTQGFDKKKWLNITFFIFIFGFVFNRYRGDATYLNGDTIFALFIYIGFAIFFCLFLLISHIKLYNKDKELFVKIKKSKAEYIFVIIWFLVMIVAVRGANRIIFLFPVINTIITSYALIWMWDISIKESNRVGLKWGLWLLLFLVLFNPFNFGGGIDSDNFIGSTFGSLLNKGVVLDYPEKIIQQAKFSGTGYSLQWQQAGKWVRDNLPKPVITTTKKDGKLEMNYEGPVFAHWWDYGYWVQTGFGMATVTDGGNAKKSLNHMMGRHVLTGQNETEALEFLKAHDATHLLIISDEIGKYPAFSSIGADENWDRYSWINVFSRDDTKTRENRDSIAYVYVGGTPLDWDFEYNGVLYPKGGAGIIVIVLPIKNSGNNSIDFGQPNAILAYGNNQINIPIECLFVDGKEIIYPTDGLKGCFFILPKINDGQVENLGNGLYISEKVRNTLFYKLYLAGQEGDYFKLAYNDESQIPLSVYNGRIIGPLKIWEISYPDDLVVPEIYYEDILPNPAVTSVEGR